jgi:hypothetical protein
MSSLSPDHVKTATVAEMIHRFRNAPPMSSAMREAMRENGDAPSKMWYEMTSATDTNSNANQDALRSPLQLNRDNSEKHNEGTCDIRTLSSRNRQSVQNNDTTEVNNNNWRRRFRFGLKNDF